MMSNSVVMAPVMVDCPGGGQDDEEVCVVCFKPVDIYSVGECDHPVCFECSTRMRVLCARNECPICRVEMAKVVFLHTVLPFANIKTRTMLYDSRYAIFFENESVMKAYDALLEHSCFQCKDPLMFKNFTQLKDHMRKHHERYYCELCVEHLKIFTRERRSYTRSQLALHRRKGDADDKSHRGHPLCEFCESRFMDNDELFRHLRRDHFFCHFCDADGIYQYYDDYDALREHFRSDHYLCEEGNCIEERFTSVFRTKLDLQAHCTQQHSQNMSKQAARQARTVDIEFTVNHRQDSSQRGGGSGRGRGGRGRGGRRERDYNDIGQALIAEPRAPAPSQQSIDINCVQDFPTLNGAGPGPGGEAGGGGSKKSLAYKVAQQNRLTIRASSGGSRRQLDEEDFPSLGASVSRGTTSVTVSTAQSPQSPSSPGTSVHLKYTKKTTATADNSITGQRPNGPNVSIQYNRTVPATTQVPSDATKPKARIGVISHSGNITVQSGGGQQSSGGPQPPRQKGLDEDFPALHISSKNTSAGPGSISWGQTTTTTPSTPTVMPSSKLSNNFDDFPSLAPKRCAAPTSKPGKSFQQKDFPSLAPSSSSQQHMKNYHGRSSLTIPVNNSWTKTTDNIPRPSEPGEGNGGIGKGKKKKKGGRGISGDGSSQGNVTNGNTKPAGKKKPIGLSNIFDESDEEGPKEDLSWGKVGEYESALSAPQSNVNLITSDTLNERKKSELKIGTLKAPPKFDSDGDFPTLGGLGGGRPCSSPLSTSTWSLQPKVSAVPPGFSKKAKVPPGFSATDMTFFSSSGEKFAISPTSESSGSGASALASQPPVTHSFILPPNFEQRNKDLIKTIHDCCKGDSVKFDTFKLLASQLRSGELSGLDYYKQCKEVMGKATFHEILPELLVLLPDIKKQLEVLKAYQNVDNNRGCSVIFAVCDVCHQVVNSEGFNSHVEFHKEEVNA
ncbi:E3 ubiquitin-protein ligase ZNF598 [Oratosquilla oratoria]|uniref:E3 ubiquitin-protein ligase ZNF598 n=1 Tax=Oratosquilla oratoria TaxID=337810 RepID=UPI003F762DEA